METKERFLSHAIPEPNSGCWIWEASYFNSGYGRFAETSRKSTLAHRMAYTLFCGSIPHNSFVCHKCDNKSCVNPDHLFIGTPQDNSTDMVNKKRQAYGVKIRKLALTKEQAFHIANSAEPLNKLAEKFGVSYGVVWGVKNGKSYKWTQGE